MNQESQYYTPSIEEFHIGFEYQIATIFNGEPTPVWESLTIDGVDEIEYVWDRKLMMKECFRVKFLDDDDLLELGWKTAHSPSYVIDDQSILLHSIGEEPKWFNLEKDGELIVITVCTIYNDVSGNWTQESVFKGRIKNKSELKRLMQQLETQ